eukprot:703349-Alexandrium_andersonii.AAC.1
MECNQLELRKNAKLWNARLPFCTCNIYASSALMLAKLARPTAICQPSILTGPLKTMAPNKPARPFRRQHS